MKTLIIALLLSSFTACSQPIQKNGKRVGGGGNSKNSYELYQSGDTLYCYFAKTIEKQSIKDAATEFLSAQFVSLFDYNSKQRRLTVILTDPRDQRSFQGYVSEYLLTGKKYVAAHE